MSDAAVFVFCTGRVPRPLAAAVPHLLDCDEQMRAGRFVRPLLGERFAAAHAGLRLLLALALADGCRLSGPAAAEDVRRCWSEPPRELLKAAAALRFAKAAGGKPYLALRAGDGADGGGETRGGAAEAGLCFSFSHSADHAALAVTLPDAADAAAGDVRTAEREIGLDIEKEEESPSRLEVAWRFFTDEEKKNLSVLTSKSGKYSRFAQLWTRKEACQKLWGTGLRTSPASFSVWDRLPVPAAGKQLPQPECRFLSSLRLKTKDAAVGGEQIFSLSLAAAFLPADTAGIYLEGKTPARLFRFTNGPAGTEAV